MKVKGLAKGPAVAARWSWDFNSQPSVIQHRNHVVLLYGSTWISRCTWQRCTWHLDDKIRDNGSLKELIFIFSAIHYDYALDYEFHLLENIKYIFIFAMYCYLCAGNNNYKWYESKEIPIRENYISREEIHNILAAWDVPAGYSLRHTWWQN